MNCFGGKFSESTTSLIKKEVIDLTGTQGDMQIKEESELEEGELIEQDEEEDVAAEEPPKLLTDEELEAIADEVDKSEEEEEEQKKKKLDLIVKLLEHSIDTILLEELHMVGEKMNAFRVALAEGALRFAEMEGAQKNKVKLDKLVDSFRAAWKDWKEKEDKKSAVDVFMKEMDNELWYPER